MTDMTRMSHVSSLACDAWFTAACACSGHCEEQGVCSSHKQLLLHCTYLSPMTYKIKASCEICCGEHCSSWLMATNARARPIPPSLYQRSWMWTSTLHFQQTMPRPEQLVLRHHGLHPDEHEWIRSLIIVTINGSII